MKTILVVDDDNMILRLAEEALRVAGEYNVLTASNGNQAVHVLNSTGVDLVLTDLKMPVMDGYELLSYMTTDYRDVPIIVMTGYGSPELAKKLKQRGVLHYIEKPFEINILRQKVSQVFEASSKGYIHGFTLANFLQTVEMEQKTTTLCIRSKRRVGYLHIESGELIDAETENIKGLDAAIRILNWEDAQIEIQGLKKKKRTIETSLMQILLEAAKEKDHAAAERSAQDPLEEAVILAEGYHYKEAQQIISGYLNKVDKRNPKAWLWYSRIIGNLKSIESSLSNAAKLAPKDTNVIEEVKKFNHAKKSISSEQVRRCPFCWAPIEVKSVRCSYCRSHLLIHSEFFKSQRDANTEILNKAIERYTRVISREKKININAYYYLSIAHLNLEHWEEALNLFNKTVNLVPEKKMFSEQMKLLLNYMALESSTEEMKDVKKDKAADIDTELRMGVKRKRILVVEDSPTTRKVISITLGQKGYDIIEARDGLEALGMLNDGKPDLILLDIILPKMDGYKILDIIKKNDLFKNIPVIMLTSRDGVMSRLKGKLAGSTAYLTKPFEPKKLVETVEKYI